MREITSFSHICGTENVYVTLFCKNIEIFDWCIAKSMEFSLVEMVRFVQNSPRSEITSWLRHRDREKCECDVISQNVFAKNSKNRILQYFATKPKLQIRQKTFYI
jgi:hypothetical protein